MLGSFHLSSDNLPLGHHWVVEATFTSQILTYLPGSTYIHAYGMREHVRCFYPPLLGTVDTNLQRKHPYRILGSYKLSSPLLPVFGAYFFWVVSPSRKLDRSWRPLLRKIGHQSFYCYVIFGIRYMTEKYVNAYNGYYNVLLLGKEREVLPKGILRKDHLRTVTQCKQIPACDSGLAWFNLRR